MVLFILLMLDIDIENSAFRTIISDLLLELLLCYKYIKKKKIIIIIICGKKKMNLVILLKIINYKLSNIEVHYTKKYFQKVSNHPNCERTII